jgi:aldose 1-epimerase
MTFQVRTEKRANTINRDDTVWLLEDGKGASATLWPAHGFNCFRWQTPSPSGPRERLYRAANFFEDERPTRSGIPILFPFPNRIRDGRFTWQGKEYHLPRNDSTGKNAIHGFVCRRPWRVLEHGADERSAWVTGEFHGSRDAPDTQPLWPADYLLRMTYRLTEGHLRIEAAVTNPDAVPLPFGLGYHPYFSITPQPGQEAQVTVQASAEAYWELEESLPTGRRLPVTGDRDLRLPRLVRDLHLDDVLTDLTGKTQEDGLTERGSVRCRVNGGVYVRTSPAFRELVAFTPPHRQAVCLEPYTCTTDAINLHQRGVDAGLRVLQPGETWSGVVEMKG